MYFGGNSELRGYDYLEFIGHARSFANAELRFPLIDAMLTPLASRACAASSFAGIGRRFHGQSFKPWSSNNEEYKPIINYQQDVLATSTRCTGGRSSSAGSA